MNVFSILVVCLISLSFLCVQCRQSKDINEQWETSNDSFKIRVTAYAEENGGVIAGAYYVFESAPVANSKTWQEIMVYRHDDPVPIPRDQIHFVSDKVGYVFMIYKYAVTTDGGLVWSTWDIVTDLPNWQNNRSAIKQVQITPDGVGTMVVVPFASQPKTVELYTEDYGRHWSMNR